MFTFDEYAKNIEKFTNQNPFFSTSSIESALEFNSKLSKIAIDTFKKNSEITQEWSKETLGALEKLTKTQKNPSDYTKVVNDFVVEQSQSSPKHLAEYAEIAKKAQLDTIDLYMTAGKEINEEMTKSAKKASNKTVVTTAE